MIKHPSSFKALPFMGLRNFFHSSYKTLYYQSYKMLFNLSCECIGSDTIKMKNMNFGITTPLNRLVCPKYFDKECTVYLHFALFISTFYLVALLKCRIKLQFSFCTQNKLTTFYYG